MVVGLMGKKNERKTMKKKTMALLAISGLLVTLQLNADGTDNKKTIAGDGACAKCILKETQECQLTVTTEADGKKQTYYLTKNNAAKEFGNQVCAEKKKVKASGAVRTVDGKQILVPTKVELAKD